jgi:molecular chaperone HscB
VRDDKMTYYEALGLEPKLSLDLDDLKIRFYDRSRQWHPDRFSRASAEEQRRALDMTALLNDAFRTLRDPWMRAEYFFKLTNVELPKELPPGALEEFFELNMTLQELKSGDESVRPQLIAAQERLRKSYEDTGAELGTLFELYDKFSEAERQETDLVEAFGNLSNSRRYIGNFLREVDKELNVHVSH